MEQCVFCKIISKEIHNFTVYEDDFALAFLDIFPHTKGHTVVVTKAHKENFASLSLDEAKRLMESVKNTIDKIQSVIKPDGFNVGWNENPAGGQVVPHLHVHIMPRYNGDGGGSMHTIVNNKGDMSVENVAKLFTQAEKPFLEDQ